MVLYLQITGLRGIEYPVYHFRTNKTSDHTHCYKISRFLCYAGIAEPPYKTTRKSPQIPRSHPDFCRHVPHLPAFAWRQRRGECFVQVVPSSVERALMICRQST